MSSCTGQSRDWMSTRKRQTVERNHMEIIEKKAQVFDLLRTKETLLAQAQEITDQINQLAVEIKKMEDDQAAKARSREPMVVEGPM